jgi:capsular polysaccharide biosynthesis protein
MHPYRIDQGIKIPAISRPAASQKSSRAMATMQLLKKGESFLIKDEIDAMRANKVMRDLLRRERQQDGTRLFVSRKIGAGIRIWRTR